MTDRIREFLRARRDDSPCLVVDLEVVRENYRAFAKALPDSRVFYAVKARSEEHTSELQSRCNLVCRLLLEKKKIRGTGMIGVIRMAGESASPPLIGSY